MINSSTGGDDTTRPRRQGGNIFLLSEAQSLSHFVNSSPAPKKIYKKFKNWIE
jgi:hypothetical protein